MHAVLVEVNVTQDVDEVASVQTLKDTMVPRVREAGACGGYWFGGTGTTRVAVLLFETEEAAQALAGLVKIGERPTDAPEGITFSRVEVSEVVASL